MRLELGLALRLADPAGLAAYARSVVTPGSASYHHYLHPSQIAARYGPPRAAIAALSEALRREGLKVGPPSANDLILPVSGRASVVEAVFHTRLVRYVSGSRVVGFAAESAPLLPARLASDVSGVLGIDNLVRPHSMLERTLVAVSHGGSWLRRKAPASSATHAPTQAPVACGGATAAAQAGGGWTDAQVARAYGLSGLYASGDYAAGQTIALYELEPFSTQDLATFDRCYFGVSHTSQVQRVAVDGFDLRGPGSGESLLDIENISALAPKARILVYEAPNTTFGGIDAFNAIVSQDRASIVSTSWGECEPALEDAAPEAQQLENTLFEEAAAQGQTVFAASGDTGSDDCASTPFGTTSPAPPYLSVDDPASQPYVVGVGGTTLLSAKNPPTQTVWNDGARWGGSGGGISSTWPSPPWQADSGVPGVSPSAGRQVPDVSATADEWRGITVYSASFASGGSTVPTSTAPAPPPGWATIGGTSSAAPTWAAVAAEIAASAPCSTLAAAAGSTHDLGFIGSELYEVAGNPVAYAGSFSQVLKGTNDVFGLGLGYHAGPGFNLATGLGTPIVTNAAGHGGLDASLCAVASAQVHPMSRPAPVVSGLSPSSGPASGGTKVTITGAGFPVGQPNVVKVAFGAAIAQVVAVPSSTQIVVTAPPATLSSGATASSDAGPVQVTVTVDGATSRLGPNSVFDEVATASSSGSSSPALPTVAGIGPSGVNVAGGVTVIVYGDGFSASDPPSVTFGGVPGTGVKVLSTFELSVVVPPKSSATKCATGPGFDPSANCQVEVVVSDAAGSSQISPILPSVAGPIIFDAKGVVEPTPETEVSPAPTELDYAPTPVITSVTPDPGDATGKIPVVIRGSGFSFNTLEWVNFGPASSVSSEQVDISTLTSNEIVIAPPPGTLGRSGAAQPLVGGISVQTAGGLSNVYPFNYAGVPSVSRLGALGGPSTGGTRLRISGANLEDATVVEFLSEVSGAAYGASATIAESARTPTSITVTTPADLPGPVDVLPCSATACAQPDPARDTFVYFSPVGPRLATMQPSSGPAQGGTSVTLFGENLNGAVAVDFGHASSSALVPAPGYPDGDPYILGVRSAPGQAGATVPVTVVTRAGRSRPVLAGRFSYRSSPPSAPRGLEVHFAGPRARLSWVAPLSDGGRPISGYEVLALAPGAPPLAARLPASARSYTFENLSAQHTYVLRVAAISALGRGLWAASGPKAVAFADNGYLVASRLGAVEGFGSLVGLGGVDGASHSSVVAIGATTDGGGYWLVQRDGTVTAFGDAPALGYPRSSSPIVAMAVENAGTSGYWLLDKEGHVYAYGAARAHGSLPSGAPPAVGIASAPGGQGYWILTADGSVWAFGSARAYPGAHRRHLGERAVAIAARVDGQGYWVLSSNGSVRAYGGALVLGAPSPAPPPSPAVALAPTRDGRGYWIVSASGAVAAFGDAHYEGRARFSGADLVAGIAAF
jgi:hypothetical protein